MPIVEVIYNLETKQVIHWTVSLDGVTPQLELKPGEGRKFVAITEKPINLINEIVAELHQNNLQIGLKTTTHWAQIVSFQSGEKPITVHRTYEGEEHEFSCYITELLFKLHGNNELNVGDYVLVTFIDGEFSKPLAISKIKKTW